MEDEDERQQFLFKFCFSVDIFHLAIVGVDMDQTSVNMKSFLNSFCNGKLLRFKNTCA